MAESLPWNKPQPSIGDEEGNTRLKYLIISSTIQGWAKHYWCYCGLKTGQLNQVGLKGTGSRGTFHMRNTK